MAYSHQRYDNYIADDPFISGQENVTSRHSAAASNHPMAQQAMRDQIQAENLEIQNTIGENLSRQTSDDYRDEVVQHMKEMEKVTLPDVAAIEIQTEIQWFMRPYLIDFLIEAHNAFSLLPETLHLTINLLDRYCSRRIVYKRHYQLVGCAALLIAAKFGDRKEYVPTIKELRCMCCGLYDDDMFTQMEWHVLQTLSWAIGHPTIDAFLQLDLEGHPSDPEVQNMARYISEIALFSKDFISELPSDMARSSLVLARYILGRNMALRFDELAVTLSQQLHRPSPILSRKYSTVKFTRVSKTLESFLAREASIARCNPTPPTPPSELLPTDIGRAVQRGAQGPCITPQKGQMLSLDGNGCPTPPITPVGTDFVGYNPGLGSYHQPSMHSSLYHQPSVQLTGRRYDTQYSLPPINPSAPVF